MTSSRRFSSRLGLHGRQPIRRSWLRSWQHGSPQPLFGLLLIIVLGAGAHASKQSLGPLEPTLHAAGIGPIGFGALTVVPGMASVIMPCVWGRLWAGHAPAVLLVSPLAQLTAQALLAAGLSSEGLAAASALVLGLLLFSLGRAGIAVAQHAMLARTFRQDNLAFGFSIVVGCTQLIASACAWAVPRVLAASAGGNGSSGGSGGSGGGSGRGSGLLQVQLLLLVPHTASSFAGALLALRHSAATPSARCGSAARPDPSRQQLAPAAAPLPEPGPERPWAWAWTGAAYDHLRRQEAMVAVWLLALWRALAVGGCHAFHPVAIALLVGGGLPLGAAGSVLAANALLSLSAFGLVGLLGRAARLKTLLVAAPLLALAASLALWRLSALSAVSADGEVGRVARGALLVIALVSAAAPIVPLALVPANAEPSRLGRGYGIVESVFEGAEASLSLLLGLCRSAGGFPLALLLLSGSFGLAALVGVPLARIAREQPADPRVRASPTECWPRLRWVRFSDGGGGGGADAAGPAETRGQFGGDYVKLRADV